MKDVYVASAARTAVGRSKKGALADYRPDEMAAVVITEAVRRAGIAPDAIQDVVMGCAFPESPQGMNVARIAVMRAGLPASISAMTINRFCSSGLEAMAVAAAKLEAGLIDAAVAGGVESMSQVPMTGNRPSPNPYLAEHMPEVYIPMGVAGDNIARDFGFSRTQLDEYAVNSHKKALDAIQAGRFKEEIVPIHLPNGNGGYTFDTDEGPRADTSLEGLSKLKPAFAASPKMGLHTAGTSSQTSDGAAALTLLSTGGLEKTGVEPIARFLAYNVAAASPKYLGPAQLEAIPRACEIAGIALGDVDLFEINEAFASVALLVMRELALDPGKVNVNGGAIALGHPLGCTGAKLSASVLHELRRRGGRYGVVTMCIGGGMGAAGVFELLK
jgi:acetyl-CoA acyltransferase